MALVNEDFMEYIEDHYDFVFYLNTKQERYYATNDVKEANAYAKTFKHMIYYAVIIGEDIPLKRKLCFTSRERFDRFMNQFEFERDIYHLVWFLIGGFRRIPDDD